METLRFAIGAMLHPVNSFEDVKKKNAGSMAIAMIIVLFWFFIAIFERQYMNFRFNMENPETLNIMFIFIRTILLYVLWITSNWSFCTLMEGKGKIREICISSAYSLIPFLVSSFLVTIIGNFISLEENIFMTLLLFAGTAWSALLLFISQMTIHEYTINKTILTILITIVGILLIIFIVLLVGCLFQQLFSFIQSIVSELLYRFS